MAATLRQFGAATATANMTCPITIVWVRSAVTRQGAFGSIPTAQKSEKFRAQWLERRRPSNFRAATRVGATAKAPSDIVELWTTHARKQFEMLSEQDQGTDSTRSEDGRGKCRADHAQHQACFQESLLRTPSAPGGHIFLGVPFPAPQHAGILSSAQKR